MAVRRSISRRSLLGAGALLGAFAASRGVAASALPPKETGLPFEGLLKGKLGFQPRRPAPLILRAIPGFLSAEQLDRNYAVYRTAFERLLATERALAAAARDSTHASQYAALRNEQIIAGNSVLMHEFYFRNLAQAATKPSRYVLANMTEHMGSLESWREDFVACARVAHTWAALVYDPYDDRWHNVTLNKMNAGGWVGANPLIVCDVAPHAYSIDYERRDEYVAAFLEHIDWNVAAARYRTVDRR